MPVAASQRQAGAESRAVSGLGALPQPGEEDMRAVAGALLRGQTTLLGESGACSRRNLSRIWNFLQTVCMCVCVGGWGWGEGGWSVARCGCGLTGLCR